MKPTKGSCKRSICLSDVNRKKECLLLGKKAITEEANISSVE